ncbi:TetR/AcrR family transcriptional regulator [Nocardioides sp. 1609]|uniref:TetR/AcrR family transcriptional regulator n=1 Tax=Nocardioides sp. 1609 TaxID=2508327 RepID=UPI0014321A0A|nr:TetR/AcrR family transcriptional regulator [Nocardioides sp. 1609]
MPRNRRHIPRDERAAELLDAATQEFVAHGYANTTIASISAAAHVARANVYWYYESKDDVFAAVMDGLLDREIEQLNVQHASLDAASRLKRGLVELYPYRHLHREMHERLPYSATVEAAHTKFMGWLTGLVREALTESGTELDTNMATDMVIAIFEGARSPTETRPAYELIPFAMELLARKT